MRLQAVLFDFGGTLDGAGDHWLVRFLRLYHAAGHPLSVESFRAAFDHATGCAYREARTSNMNLRQLIEFHVAHHMQWLGLEDTAVAAQVVEEFVSAAGVALADSRAVLEHLRRRVKLGVVSNFYGNVEHILEDAGLAPLLATVIDSNRVGLRKPDPAIFALALRCMNCEPGATLHVGDSFDHDVVGAKSAGLHTAWVTGSTDSPCRAPELVDVRVRRLAELDAYIE